MSGREREGFNEDKQVKNIKIIGMRKDLRTSLKQKLDHLKITKNPRRDGQHPRILKDKADSIKKIIEANIFNSLLTPREESAKDQKEMLDES